MEFKEIIEELQNQEITNNDFAYGDMVNPLPKIGTWTEVDQHGGEGEGDDWWSVKYFRDHNIYIKIYGYYTSYEGTTFDRGIECYSEVIPKEETVIVYRSV